MQNGYIRHNTIQVGAYGVNCTILADESRAVVVDPGSDSERIIESLRELGKGSVAILLTHGHFDHIGAVNALEKAFPGVQTYVHPSDVVMLAHPANRMPPDYPGIELPKNICDCREFAGIEVIETPGHTKGGVCYYLPRQKLLLSGDTLFAGSVGRTDFPGGDMAEMIASLEKLTALPGDTTVIPGHGPTTTIAEEIRLNPFIRS